MKLLITDTNVFFDLMTIEALQDFFGLDFVINEILQIEQAEQIQNFIRSKALTIFQFSANEIEEISNLKTKRSLRRITDKSVLWKAMQLKCRLLTGDKSLRNEAEEQGLEVGGSIWVVRMLIETKIVPRGKGIEFLENLKAVNASLPKDEIDKLVRRFKRK